MADLLRLFGGEFTQIHSFVRNDFWNHDVEDNAYALMGTDDGIVAMLHSSATQWRHQFSLDIACTKGSITLSGILSSSKSYGRETMTVAWASDDDLGEPKEQTTHYNKDPSWADEIGDFVDAVDNDRSIDAGNSLDALKSMELIYRIYCADPTWRKRWNLSVNTRPSTA
jgi:predicted dehydrogenase